MASILQSSHAWREVWAEELLDRLTPIMSALGVLFLLAGPDAFSQILEVVLAIFSVVVFATLAGSVGAYFLRQESARPAAPE